MIFDWIHLDTEAHFPVAALYFNIRKSFVLDGPSYMPVNSQVILLNVITKSPSWNSMNFQRHLCIYLGGNKQTSTVPEVKCHME